MGKIFKLPIFGRIAIATDRHGAATRAAAVTGQGVFETNLSVKVLDANGNEKKIRTYFGDTKWQKLVNTLLYRQC